jgi:hypothetical protein
MALPRPPEFQFPRVNLKGKTPSRVFHVDNQWALWHFKAWLPEFEQPVAGHYPP